MISILHKVTPLVVFKSNDVTVNIVYRSYNTALFNKILTPTPLLQPHTLLVLDGVSGTRTPQTATNFSENTRHDWKQESANQVSKYRSMIISDSSDPVACMFLSNETMPAKITCADRSRLVGQVHSVFINFMHILRCGFWADLRLYRVS